MTKVLLVMMNKMRLMLLIVPAEHTERSSPAKKIIDKAEASKSAEEDMSGKFAFISGHPTMGEDYRGSAKVSPDVE